LIEQTSFEEFIRTHGEELLRLAFTYVKNKQTAEDIVQDVLMKAYEKREEFRGEANYKTYLYRMTINRSYDYLRSWTYKRIIYSQKMQEVLKSESRTENIVIEKSTDKAIGEAILMLPIKYREVIVLYYYKELKIEEIAILLELSINTVKTRLKRGREKLKPMLEGSDLHERFSN